MPACTGSWAAVERRGEQSFGRRVPRCKILQKLKSGPTYGTPLSLATFHLCCGDIDAAADWIERAITERHPAVFFFLQAHAQELRGSARWPALASLLKLP
jgi:hypothetical protein